MDSPPPDFESLRLPLSLGLGISNYPSHLFNLRHAFPFYNRADKGFAKRLKMLKITKIVQAP